MAQDTTAFTDWIHSEYITGMIVKYLTKKQLDALFKDGARGEDVQKILSDGENMLRCPTNVVTDGKTKKVVVPIRPRAAGSVTPLAQVNDAVEVAPTYGTCELVLAEYGRQKATVTGLAQLQVFTDVLLEMMAYIVECAADTKELLIGAVITQGGTKAASAAADKVKYFQAGPVPQGGGVFKPSRILEGSDIDMSVTALRTGGTMPFANGLFMGVIHAEQVTGLKAMAGSDLEKFELFATASPFPSPIRMFAIGVWKGVQWFWTDNAYFKVAAGSHDGSPAYKTAIFGQNFLAKAYVDVANLPLSAKSDVVQVPFDDFVVRLAPDYSDPHCRGTVVTPWMVLSYGVAVREDGLYIVACSNFSGSEASAMA